MAWKPDYCTTEELGALLSIHDDYDDVELGLAIAAASRAVDHATNRQFGQTETTETRTFDDIRWSRTNGVYITRVDDIQTLTGLVVTIAGSATTAYETQPDNAIAKGKPIERIWSRSVTCDTGISRRNSIEVTASFGWLSVPDTVKEATLLQASRFFKRKDAPFGVAGSPDVGSEVRLLAKVDPDVQLALQPFRRDWPYL